MTLPADMDVIDPRRIARPVSGTHFELRAVMDLDSAQPCGCDRRRRHVCDWCVTEYLVTLVHWQRGRLDALEAIVNHLNKRLS